MFRIGAGGERNGDTSFRAYTWQKSTSKSFALNDELTRWLGLFTAIFSSSFLLLNGPLTLFTSGLEILGQYSNTRIDAYLIYISSLFKNIRKKKRKRKHQKTPELKCIVFWLGWESQPCYVTMTEIHPSSSSINVYSE